MTIEAFIAENESPTDQIRCAVVGPEKNGKSRLCSTAPTTENGATLFLDYDRRAKSVAGISRVYVLTFKDPGGYQMPTACQETFDILTKLESSLCINKLHPNFSQLRPDTKVENVVLDSGVSLGKCVADFEMYNNKDLGRTIKVGPSLSVRIQQNFDAWNAEIKTVEDIILRLFALPLDVYMVLHETSEHADDSTTEKPKFTGKITVFPERYSRLLRYFNEVWRVKLTPGGEGGRFIPKVYPLPDYAFSAATAMLLDTIEEPNIAKMIAKHNQRALQAKTKSLLEVTKVAGVSK